LEKVQKESYLLHRTALVVPRKIAHLIEKRPDLVNAAIQIFCQSIDTPPTTDLTEYEDWVWTTHSFSRTNYAMARTMVSPEWKSQDFLPSFGIEVKRYQRQCAMESTPHVCHALQMGVRLVVGLEYLQKESSLSLSSMDQRIAGWSRIDQDCYSDENGRRQNQWILQAFQQGPNVASYNLDYVLKCPVFPEEYGNLTLTIFSRPEESIKQQIRQAQISCEDDDKEFIMPRPEDIDADESWMILEGGGEEGNSDLEGMLSKFSHFMVQPSSVEGVSSSRPVKREIRPRAFMNILHAVLKGDELLFPAEDPYFFQEDYDLMEANDDDDGADDQGMKNLMEAMDAELQGKTASRTLDKAEGTDDDNDNEEVAEGAHVLSNLLQSLEAGAGTPGPANNMLKEMGIDPTHLEK
jgi:hypothetical protein